jgi:hypothetical protein
MKLRFFVFIFAFFAVSALLSAEPQPGLACRFMQDTNREIALPSDLKSVKIDDYFRIHYSASDPLFQDVDRNSVPDTLDKKSDTIARSRYLFQTVLGWKMPASNVETGKAELNVYFLALPQDFGGTVRSDKELRVLLNRSILESREFSALWIHALAHAVELQYRSSGDYWFYEATAGWIEGQFDGYSRATLAAQLLRSNRPGIPITDSAPMAALGASRFVDTLSRPYKDIVRQIWDQWSYAKDESLMDIIQKTLTLNHLPGLASYLQNYFLLSRPVLFLQKDTTDVIIPPYAAVVFRGRGGTATGGVRFLISPDDGASYSANVLYYSTDKTGTLAMKMGTNEPWSVIVPYASLDHYALVVVNTSAVAMKVRISRAFDSSIPAVLEYFKASQQQEGLSVEWKTTREDGVAFWNVYRVQDGKKTRVNDFPIPATIDSDQGIHYLFLDSSAGAMYWLEAITEQGLPSTLATTEP